MKQICLTILAMCVIAAIATAATNEVTSVNVVGYVKVSIPSNSTAQVALQFDPITAANTNLVGTFGTNQFRRNAFAANVDKVFFWVPAQGTYHSYAMHPTAGWCATTNWGVAADRAVVAGEGFWVQTPGSGPYATQALELVLMGDVVDVVTQSINVVTSFQMIAYPFTCDAPISNLDLAADGAVSNAFFANCDHIYTWNGTAYEGFGLKNDGKWHYQNNWGVVVTNDVLPLGRGFWYEAKNAFMWTETNKYRGNL